MTPTTTTPRAAAATPAAPSMLQNTAALAGIAVAALGPLLPFLGGQAIAAGAVASALSNALSAMAARGGAELTEADWQAALSRDDAAIADNAAAHLEGAHKAAEARADAAHNMHATQRPPNAA